MASEFMIFYLGVLGLYLGIFVTCALVLTGAGWFLDRRRRRSIDLTSSLVVARARFRRR